MSDQTDRTETDRTDRPTRNRRPLALAAGAAVLTLAVGLGAGFWWGHGSSGDDATTDLSSLQTRASATDHDAADVAFAQQMTPHHEQAITMSKLVDARAASADVRSLATTIEGAQGPEITAMKSWLQKWGAAAPASDSGEAQMTGMMSQSDMDRLATLSGATFDHEWLTMMIAHHQGALDMARTELAQGRNADALALAASIELTQQAQIDQMKAMLGS